MLLLFGAQLTQLERHSICQRNRAGRHMAFRRRSMR